MPQCSVLQGCKLLAVLLRSLRMDACAQQRLAAWFTAVDRDATAGCCAQNSRNSEPEHATSVQTY